MKKNTEFEAEIKTYFPELYDIYVLTKDDRKVWTVIKSMLDMFGGKFHGRIEITYQEGKINHVFQTENKDI